MSVISFLEVDTEDVSRVEKKYPDAAIASDTLQNGSVDPKTEILCCFIYSKIGKKDIEALPHLKLIVTRSVGFDHIDLETCAKKGITVCNVPDYGSHVIAEHVFALLLSASRHISEADKRVEEGNFDYRGLRGMALKGKTIGVIGTGKIGRKVCKIAHGFGMNILAFDMCRTLELEDLLDVKYLPLNQVLAESDVITLHLPATKDTEHVINAESIATMRDGVTLINTARGTLIDTKALTEGLNKDKFSYVLLDVLEHEKNFEENKKLIAHPNVVTTPHIAFFADDSMKAMYDDCFESIDQFMNGETPTHVAQTPNVVCDLDGLKK